MATRLHGGQPPWKKSRVGPTEVPRDMKGCAVGCYICGQSLPIIVDVMVLGNSLKENEVKAEKVLCIHDETREMSISKLMKAFWEIVPVHQVPLPKHLKGSEQERLQGVYSKLQTVNLFSSGSLRKRRFLLMDADMLVRANLDDVFALGVPAGVMRGDIDSCLLEPRPSRTLYYPGTTMRPGGSHPPMKGGINRGMVLFEPSADTYKDMTVKLRNFRPSTKMAEKEFLNHYWANSWHTMDKKYNFQIHQLYFASPEAPPGQERQSSFAYIAVVLPDPLGPITRPRFQFWAASQLVVAASRGMDVCIVRACTGEQDESCSCRKTWLVSCRYRKVLRSSHFVLLMFPCGCHVCDMDRVTTF